MEEGEQGMLNGECRGMTCKVFGREKHYVKFLCKDAASPPGALRAIVATLNAALTVPISPSTSCFPACLT